MDLDINRAETPHVVAAPLHPHPHYGGNRFHPFVDGLFRRLPTAGITAVRFDFTGADPDEAAGEAVEAIDRTAPIGSGLSVFLAGYSFGAGVAAHIDDDRIAAWYLLAPQATALATATIGTDARPKAIAVPADDQYSPPTVIEPTIAAWVATAMTVVDGADHFLGTAVPRIVDDAYAWIVSIAG